MTFEGRDTEAGWYALGAGALFGGGLAFALAAELLPKTGALLAWTLVLSSSAIFGFVARRGARFRLRLDPEGPVLEKRLFGLCMIRLALPTGIRARREGLLDWGEDGEDGREALTALSLEGSEAPLEPLLVGTRADADELPSAIEAALEAVYPGARDETLARLDRNRTWAVRLQALLARRLGGRRPSPDRPSPDRPSPDGRSSVTRWAGLLAWETPSLSVFGALAFLVGAGLAEARGREDMAFALVFTVSVLSAWRFVQLVREDHARAELGEDDEVTRIVIERRWLGVRLRRRVITSPKFVLPSTWRSARPLTLSVWPSGSPALEHVHAALDAEAAASWASLSR